MATTPVVKVNGDVLFSATEVKQDQRTTVAPGPTTVSITHLPEGAIASFECRDIEVRGMPARLATGVSVTHTTVTKHRNVCVIRVSDRANAKREVVAPNDADVSIFNTNGQDAVEVGSTEEYYMTLTITNAGLNDAVNVTVSDQVDSRLIITRIEAEPQTLEGANRVTCSSPDAGGNFDNFVQCFVGRIPYNPIKNVGFTVSIFFRAPTEVANPDEIPRIDNTGNVTADTPDVDLANNVGFNNMTLVILADLEITLTGITRVIAGNSGNYNYTYEVCNKGLSNALNVVANWTFPADLVIVGQIVINPATPSAITPMPQCTRNGQMFSCSGFNLPSPNPPSKACQSFQVSTRVFSTAQGPRGGNVEITGNAYSAIQDPDLGNNVAVFPVRIDVIADIRVTKSGDLFVVAGNATGAKFDMVITNAGPSQAYGVRMQDFIPREFINLVATPEEGPGRSCTIDPANNEVLCQLGNIPAPQTGVNNRVVINVTYTAPANAVATIQLPSQAPGPNPITNIADISALSPDVNPGDNSDPHFVGVIVQSDVYVSKTCPPGPIISGTPTTFNYTITAGNRGPSDATGVVLTDQIPSQFQIVNAIAFTSGFPVACDPIVGNLLTCRVNNRLPVGAVFVVDVTVRARSDIRSDQLAVNTVRISTTAYEVDSSVLDNEFTCDTLIQSPPDVTVTKTGISSILVDDPTSVYFYTINVINNGPTNAADVRLIDDIPPQFVLSTADVTISGGNAGSAYTFANSCAAFTSGNRLECRFGALNFGQPNIRLLVGFRVPASLLEQTVNNCAQVSAFLDSNLNNNEDCHPIVLVNSADLTVMKSTNPLCAGESGVYTITVKNNGPATARDVNLTDAFPAALTGLSVIASPTGSNCAFTGNNLFCTLPNLVNQAMQLVTVAYTVPSNYREPTIVNTVSVATSSFEKPEDRMNTFTDVTAVCVAVDVSIIKTGTATATAGTASNAQGPYTFTMTVTNWGPSDATDVTVSDTFPAGFVGTNFQVSGGGDCTFAAQNSGVVCSWLGQTFQAPPNQRTESIIISYRVEESVVAGTYINTATVSTPDNDIFRANNTDTHPVQVDTVSPLIISKRGPTVCIEAGQGEGVYTIQVTNQGPSRAYRVNLEDTIPAPFQYVVSSLEVTGSTVNGSPSCNAPVNNVIICNWGDMRPSDSVTVVYRLSVPASAVQDNQGQINTATASSICSTLNCQRTSFVATYNTLICANADLAVTKTASSGPFIAGDGSVHSFELTITNNGPATAYDATLDDFGFTGGVIQTITSNLLGSCNMFTGRCTYPSLGPGVTDTVTVTFTIPATFPCGRFPNTARVNSITNDPNPSNDEVTIEIDVVTRHEIVTSKTGPSTLIAGGPSDVYTVTVFNNGPSTATDVIFTDIVPAPLEVFGSLPDNCSRNGNQITCSLGNMAVNVPQTITYQVRVAADAVLTSEADNIACARSNVQSKPDCEQVVTGRECSTVRTNVICLDNLSITKDDCVVEPIVAGKGEIFTFKFVVLNQGPSTSRNVVIRDEWPSAYTLLGVPATNFTNGNSHICQLIEGGRVMECNWPELEVNFPIEITQQYFVAANVVPGPVTNEVSARGTCSNSETVTASDTNIIENNADLSIIKDDCDTQIIAGSTMPNTFTFTVSNAGPSDATNVVVTDVVPAVYEWTSVETQGENQPVCVYTDEANGRRFACTYAFFPVNTTSLITMNVKVGPDVLPQLVDNCASVESADIEDPNTDNNQDCDLNQVVTLADLEATKTLNQNNDRDCIVAGDTISSEYIINITNNGPSTARVVDILEALPASAIITSQPSNCERVGTSNNFTCIIPTNNGNLDAGDFITFSFGFRIASSAPQGIITNFVQAYSQTTDPELCNNNFTLASAVCRYADLSVSKDDGVSFVTAGDGIVYKYIVRGTNFGPSDASMIVLEDIWPNWNNGMPGFKLLEVVGANCTHTNEGIACRIAHLAAFENYEFCISYTVDSCTMACQLCNVISISSDAIDPNLDNNQDTDCNEVRTEADLEICKSDNVDAVTAGDGVTYTYTIEVSNKGPSCALKTSIVDHFPDEVTQIIDSIIPSIGSCVIEGAASGSPTGNDFSCNFGTLQVGQVVTVFASYTVPSNASTCSVTNVVTASSTTFDPVQCNNDAKDVNALLEKASLSVSKTVSDPAVLVTSRTDNAFTIAVSNSGPSTARDVVLTDLWPATLCQYPQRLHTSQGRCVTTGGDITCMVGDVEVGAVVTVVVPFSVCDKSVAGVVTNTVSAFSPTDDLCRDASASLTLTNAKRASKPKRQTRVVQPTPKVVSELVTTFSKKKSVGGSRRPVMDARLAPIVAQLTVQQSTGNKFKLKATNTNVVPIRFASLEVHLTLVSGEKRTIDLMLIDGDVKASSCASFAARKLPKNWSEECSVELAADLEIKSAQFVAGGASKTHKGMAPVVAQAHI